MANGYFERGEVYSVRMDSGVGSEEGAYRPGIIISTNEENNTNDTVIVMYMTTHQKYKFSNKGTWATGKLSWILEKQVATIDKSRLNSSRMGALNDAELRWLDDTLEKRFGLGYKDDFALEEKDKEIETLEAKIVELTNELAQEQAKTIELAAKHDEELLSYKLENTMWQKCYDKTMDMLVRTTVEGTYAGRILKEAPKNPEPENPPVVLTPTVPEGNPPVEGENEDTDDRVDINHCSKRDLMKIGFSEVISRAVIAARPFETVEDLKDVPYMNKKKFQILAPKVCCTPMEPQQPEEPAKITVPVVNEEPEAVAESEKKLNINGVLAKELHEVTGVASSTCYRITQYRNQNGPYTKLEDLLPVPQVYPPTLEKLRDKIEFGPMVDASRPRKNPRKVEEPTEPYTGEKVNINTASAKEICDKTGLSMTVCYSIVGCRKRDGLYTSVKDLENVPRFNEYHMKKYGSMFEV